MLTNLYQAQDQEPGADVNPWATPAQPQPQAAPQPQKKSATAKSAVQSAPARYGATDDDGDSNPFAESADVNVVVEPTAPRRLLDADTAAGNPFAGQDAVVQRKAVAAARRDTVTQPLIIAPQQSCCASFWKRTAQGLGSSVAAAGVNAATPVVSDKIAETLGQSYRYAASAGMGLLIALMILIVWNAIGSGIDRCCSNKAAEYPRFKM